MRCGSSHLSSTAACTSETRCVLLSNLKYKQLWISLIRYLIMSKTTGHILWFWPAFVSSRETHNCRCVHAIVKQTLWATGLGQQLFSIKCIKKYSRLMLYTASFHNKLTIFHIWITFVPQSSGVSSTYLLWCNGGRWIEVPLDGKALSVADGVEHTLE